MIESDGQFKILLDKLNAVWYNQTDPSHYRPDGIKCADGNLQQKRDRAMQPYPTLTSFQQVFVFLSV